MWEDLLASREFIRNINGLTNIGLSHLLKKELDIVKLSVSSCIFRLAFRFIPAHILHLDGRGQNRTTHLRTCDGLAACITNYCCKRGFAVREEMIDGSKPSPLRSLSRGGTDGSGSPQRIPSNWMCLLPTHLSLLLKGSTFISF